MIARVVNLRHEPYDVYIGRAGNGEPTNVPGGDGRFGNRFATPFLPRGSIILTHRMWFLAEMNRVPNVFRDAVHALLDLPRPAGELRLGCFCKQPGSQVSCHGDVIAEYLNSMENE